MRRWGVLGKKSKEEVPGGGALFPLLLLVLTGLTLWILLRGCSLQELSSAVSQARLRWLAGGFALMLFYVGLEGLCIKLTMETMEEKPSLGACIRYAFIGFYFSGITPSASGGQPAQVYCMGRDRFGFSKSALCLLLISSIYQLTMIFYGAAVYALQYGFLSRAVLPVKWLLFLGGGLNVILVTIILFMMFSPGKIEWLLRACSRLAHSEKLEAKLCGLMKEYAQGALHIKKNPGLILILFGITAARLSILYSMPYFVALAFGVPEYSVFRMVGLQAMLTLAVSSLPFPGSVGISEGTSLLLFGVMFSSGLLLPAMLLLRGISFYAVLAASGAVLLATSLLPRFQGTKLRAFFIRKRYNEKKTRRLLMKVFDRINNKDLDLTAEEMIDLVANQNRQVDLTFDEKQTDVDGYMSWDAENWTTVDGRKFIRCYSLEGRVLGEATHYNIYDMKGFFQPDKARTVVLG